MRSVPGRGAACLVLFLLCWPIQAGAQPASERAGTEADSAGASAGQGSDLTEALRQAIVAYEQGDLVNARRLFELVHAAAPTARTLRSLGLVAFRQQRYPEAVELLEASLANQSKPLTDAHRKGVATVLAEVRARLPSAEQPPLPDAAVSSPSSVEEAVATAPIEVARIAPQPALVPPPMKDSVAPVPRQGARARRIKRAGYALLGVAFAALVTSATSYGIGVSRLRGIERACRRGPDPGCELEYVRAREREERLDMLGKLSLASGIVGGVSAAGGGTLLIWQWRSEVRSVGQATFGVGWRGYF